MATTEPQTTPTPTIDQLMTVKQASQRLNTGLSFIYQSISSGRLQCYQFGKIRGRIRISERQLANFLEQSQKRTSGPVVMPLKVEAPPTTIELSRSLNKAFCH